jgi:hypothetical protein
VHTSGPDRIGDLGQHLGRPAAHHQQPAGQLVVQPAQAVGQERPAHRAGRPQQRVVQDEHPEHRVRPRRGGGQRGMVAGAQVPPEPQQRGLTHPQTVATVVAPRAMTEIAEFAQMVDCRTVGEAVRWLSLHHRRTDGRRRA